MVPQILCTYYIEYINMALIITDLPEDLVGVIISHLSSIEAVSLLASTCKTFQKRCNGNDVWKRFYAQYVDQRYIPNDAKHIGVVTWNRCSVGPYPGWRYSNEPIFEEEGHGRCKNKDHYNDLPLKEPKLQYKDYQKRILIRMRTMEYSNIGNKFTKSDISEHKYITDEIEQLKWKVAEIESRICNRYKTETKFFHMNNKWPRRAKRDRNIIDDLAVGANPVVCRVLKKYKYIT